MKRFLDKSLLSWKDQSSRKPLLLQGARQVGKTYLLEEFGRREFNNYHLFDFTEAPALQRIFEQDLNPERIIQDLSIYADRDLSLAEDLIIFDEIQDSPTALTSLKYFQKEYPEAFICASGSLLGIGLAESPFPVGKVDRLHLYPMTFFEFLLAIGQERLHQALMGAKESGSVSPMVHEKTWRYLKYYFVTGGLPEVVATFVQHQEQLNTAFKAVRDLQGKLHKDYLDDIAKHSGKTKAVHITTVFNNVPMQLARETTGTKKFIFKNVLPSDSKYATLRDPIEWLIKAGLIHKVPICKRCRLPLKAYTDENKFNLYLFDIGMLGAMIDLSYQSILNYDYGSYKGYFAENFVLQELVAQWNKTFFSWNENTASIEFLMALEGEPVPMEVKANKSSKAKSLSVFCQKYQPQKTVLFSGQPLKISASGQDNCPLYLASLFPIEKKDRS
ncbi:ATP-binding protein [Planctomycetota bacterium]